MRPVAGANRRARRSPLPRWAVLLLAILLEVAVAMIVKEVKVVGLIHAVAVGAAGAFFALRRDLGGVMGVLAYLTGSEVLWRQARAPIFYLAAPYALIGLSLFAIIIVMGKLNRDGRMSMLYIALLLPATVITLRTGGQDVRELIAFALSGPIALAAMVALASQVTTTRAMYIRILWIAMISTVGPLTVAIADVRQTLADLGSISFSTQSNSVTSGGFGPVQVSSALGLGILCGILIIIMENDKVPRIIAGITACVLTVQTLLTFSRGGSFAVAIAVAILFVSQARNRRIRNRIGLLAGVALILAYFLLFPWLDTFTQGQFDERFSDTSSARTTLAANDTEIFGRNIAFGVGPGMTKYQRLTYAVCKLRSDQCAMEASSHTEFTRMLGEHGLAGVAAIFVLSGLALSVAHREAKSRPLALAWIGWAVAQMFYANLRIVAVPFAFGIAFIRIHDPVEPPDPQPPEPEPDARRGGARPHVAELPPLPTPAVPPMLVLPR